jgi:hypothetical protein
MPPEGRDRQPYHDGARMTLVLVAAMRVGLRRLGREGITDTSAQTESMDDASMHRPSRTTGPIPASPICAVISQTPRRVPGARAKCASELFETLAHGRGQTIWYSGVLMMRCTVMRRGSSR